ncbi:MAG: UPF0149 family protein [Pseudomonadota bacterium]|nr:UPF0149 family protein [Pseudomonadota bacterium]
MENLGFNEILKGLQSANSQLHPSVLHGLVSGLCCAKFSAKDQWQQLLLGDSQEDQELMAALIAKVFSETEQALSDIDFTFEPLLPEETSSLNNRVKAMVGWCQSFIHAFDWASKQRDKQTDIDTESYLSEITTISELDTGHIEQEDEVDFMDIIGFLKICVLNIYAEHAIQREPVRSSPNKDFLAELDFDDDPYTDGTTIH